jgi:hypothetical protein
VCGLVRAQVVFSKNDLPAGELTSKVIRQRRKKKIWEKGGGKRGEGERGRMDERVQSRVCPGDVQKELYFQSRNPEKYWARWTPVTSHPALLHSFVLDYCAYTTLYAAFCTLFYFSCFIFGLTLTHSPRFRIIEDPTDPAIQKGKLSRGLCPPLPWIHAQSHLEAQGTVNLPRVEPSGLKYNQ